MPATPADARDLLISAVLCDDPVLYIDDRWLYECESLLPPVVEVPLEEEGPRLLVEGSDLTLVGVGHSTKLCLDAAEELGLLGISAEVVDIRVLNPLDPRVVIQSALKTRRLLVVDGGWRNCGFAGEIVAQVAEGTHSGALIRSPVRLTLPDAAAPTSGPLERDYYTTVSQVVKAAETMMDD